MTKIEDKAEDYKWWICRNDNSSYLAYGLFRALVPPAPQDDAPSYWRARAELTERLQDGITPSYLDEWDYFRNKLDCEVPLTIYWGVPWPPTQDLVALLGRGQGNERSGEDNENGSDHIRGFGQADDRSGERAGGDQHPVPSLPDA